MADQPRHISSYTGTDVENAITKALQLDSFESQSSEVIDGINFHILWKVAPTTSNTVYGLAIHPQTGELLKVKSANNAISFTNYSTISFNVDGETLTLD
jgi:hypothetical protein